MEIIRIGLIEDQAIIRENLRSALLKHPSLEVGLESDSMEGFLAATKGKRKPELDLLLVDIELPKMNGIEGIRYIRMRYPEADIVMLTTHEDDDKIFSALRAGACSYISKRTSLADIREAVFVIRRGGSYMSPSIARRIAAFFMPKEKPKTREVALTPRQREIVREIVDGRSYQEVAENLEITLDTVRDHIKRIYRALEINSKAELIKKSLNREI